MAFFSEKSSDYFSFAFHPTASQKAFVFHLTKKQIRLFSSVFPKLAAISSLFFFTLMGLLLLRLFGFKHSPYDMPIVVVSTAFSLFIYFICIFGFLWIRQSSQSKLADDQRVRLNLQVNLHLSISFYLTCILTMVTPFLGLVILTGSVLPREDITSDFGLLPIVLISMVIVAASVFCILKIKSLFSYPRKN